MWRNELVGMLFYDIMPLKRRGEAFTWKSLDHLRSRLVSATVYACGAEEDVAKAVSESEDAKRPSLFDENRLLIPLPQADMLLEYTAADGERRAVLLSDRDGRGLEAYVFRFRADRDRWMWPLAGMLYGPSFESSLQIAIYEPTVLAKLSDAAKGAMVRDHSVAMGVATSCLALVRRGDIAPEGEVGRSAAEIQSSRTRKVAGPTPSSMARAARTHHEIAGTRKGATRSSG